MTLLCDFIIIHEETEYPAHRIILAAHSGYFRSLCLSGFKESSEGKVHLHEDPEVAVRAMTHYFYNFIYHVDHLDAQNRLHAHSTVFTIADKYDIPALKNLALEKFKSCATFSSSSVFAAYAVPDKLATALIEAVPQIYHDSPLNDHRLRAFVVSRFMADAKRLLRACEKAAFDKMVIEVPELACDLIPALSGIKMQEDEVLAVDGKSGKKK